MQNENEIDLDKLIFEFANYINQDFLNKGNEFPLENKVSIKKILLNFKDEYRSFSLGGSIKSPQSLTIDIIKRDYLNFKNKKFYLLKILNQNMIVKVIIMVMQFTILCFIIN